MTTTTQSPRPAKRDFAETQWSLIRAAAGGPKSPVALAAMETLCETYWSPIYVYLRGRGHSEHDAEDLTQKFLIQIIKDEHTFSAANKAKGKFRSYLLGALNHFLDDDWDRSRAKKRGADETILSLEDAELKYVEVASQDATPEEAYDDRWRLTVLNEALKQLEEEFRADGKTEQFEILKPYLEPGKPREELARKLNVSIGTAAVMAHRFREQYKEAVRAVLAHTVTDEEELEDELRYLFGG